MKKYLNLGCGYHYSSEREWTNLDFTSTGPGVIAHNLLKGIPFNDNEFDLVYHSHVLEHFSKEDGERMIEECFRVLKPGGIIRIAIPDLEIIVKKYLFFLEKGLDNPGDEITAANYNWMMLEMYDQTVRNISGGNMAKYLYAEKIPNEDFVFERIGEEGKAIRNNFLNSLQHLNIPSKNESIRNGPVDIIGKVKKKIKHYLTNKLKINETAMEIGRFRLGGEIHQWMYDRYSLGKLLVKHGGKDIRQRDAFSSYIHHWAIYDIDGKERVTRKPDSLFIEAVK